MENRFLREKSGVSVELALATRVSIQSSESKSENPEVGFLCAAVCERGGEPRGGRTAVAAAG